MSPFGVEQLFNARQALCLRSTVQFGVCARDVTRQVYQQDAPRGWLVTPRIGSQDGVLFPMGRPDAHELNRLWIGLRAWRTGEFTLWFVDQCCLASSSEPLLSAKRRRISRAGKRHAARRLQSDDAHSALPLHLLTQ
jgi:hypothetical protein